MRMKIFLTIGGFFFQLANTAFANCQLDTPISIAGNSILETNPSNMITLEHIVFDKAYKTKVIPPVNSIANMQMRIFEISWSKEPFGEQKPTGWAGAHFGPKDSSDSMGFSYNYGGDFLFEGAISNSSDSRTYRTSVRSRTEKKALTAISITLKGNDLTAIEITVPVRDLIMLPQGGYYSPYLGENETLCVKSASEN